MMADGVCARSVIDYRRGLEQGAAAVILTQPLLDGDDLAGTGLRARLDSPLGELGVAASDAGIVRIAFAGARGLRGDRRAAAGAGPTRAASASPSITGGLEAYFGGEPRAPMRDVVDWRLSTPITRWRR